MATFIESSVFARTRPAYLDDDEYVALQQYLLREPSAGPVVPGVPGHVLRKLVEAFRDD